MTFRQFAFKNVSRNKRTYAAFFISSVFSVMIFFIYAMFIFHPEIKNGNINANVKIGMIVAEYIIYLFSFFFLFYCVGAFLKKREKEFGILFMHGMTRFQRNMLIFMENFIIGSLSIVFGIGLGMVLCKLFFLFAGFLLEVEALPFYFPLKAIALTVAAFLFLFVAISVCIVLFLRRSNLLELLQGSQRPKREPKASVFLSLLAAGLLGTAYVLAFRADGMFVPLLLLPVSALTIAGTYLLFTQLSVFMIRLLKRNRRFYWKRTNLVTLSDLAYRVKDNARMFFLVCIVSTVAFCAIGTLAALASSIEETVVKTHPFAFEYRQYVGKKAEQEYLEKRLAKIETALAEGGFSFEKYALTMRYLPVPESADKRYSAVAVVKQSDYNRFARAAGAEEVTAVEGEAIYYSRRTGERPIKSGTLQIGSASLQLKSGEGVPLMDPFRGEPLVVVQDELYDQVKAEKEQHNYGYVVDNWKETKELSEKLDQEFSDEDAMLSDFIMNDFSARTSDYYMLKQLANTSLFIGLFVGVLFFVAAASFLYFRLYTDLENDKRQYGAITRIGLSEQELSKIVTTQIALLFFAPILVAIVHSAVAFVSLQSFLKLLFIASVFKPTLIVLASFVLVQFVYFWIIRNRYLFHLKKAVL
ncbi:MULTISPECIES: FtsX-like permease family protein [unclassified Brevibacillus]|jgi:putative ABC transport system permease protein|uniref:FtsX-like permease family protein n=1 Tax=unclassified Brevibacillus TaxID=2684853 RepID=UPI0014923AB8|nr:MULTISPECIES: ABC transporter permease [unclassified Brevibacillus]MBR8658949.1 ABC transporter permease [Brevibacillus sp. NL20B1]NNV04425.1 ABC transporter permease [Brevibacillus sp. MCWH]